jgi:hypothetical protein
MCLCPDCASLPGGIECVAWLAKLAWDMGPREALLHVTDWIQKTRIEES